jgi:uncharacterized membrane protein
MPGTQFVVGSFPDENAAGEALSTLLRARDTQALAVTESALIRKEDDGRISVKEQGDVGAGVGAVAGGLLGSILGYLTGRPFVGAGVGAVVGGAGANLDRGIPDFRLNEIAAGLANGSSAAAVVVADSSLAETRGILELAGGRVTAEPIAIETPELNIPDTGNRAVDEWADKAAATVVDFAGRAEKALGGLAGRAEEAMEGAAAAARDKVEDVRGAAQSQSETNPGSRNP